MVTIDDEQMRRQLRFSDMTDEEVTTEANECYGLHLQSMRDGMQRYARRAGEALNEMKRRLGHGQWLPWLKENFRGSQETACVYMRIAHEWDRILREGWEDCTLEELRRLLKPLLNARLRRAIKRAIERWKANPESIQFSEEQGDYGYQEDHDSQPDDGYPRLCETTTNGATTKTQNIPTGEQPAKVADLTGIPDDFRLKFFKGPRLDKFKSRLDDLKEWCGYESDTDAVEGVVKEYHAIKHLERTCLLFT